ncbi:DgyrCDS13731 [Dimorphilus gyrociliatus]|uniref:DgyrCDS13731 n=1 Tax=Dimorphilus gyrociliatus TaxID=2664684 RepID=A0A7I8WBP5_9ANNE|nr:DgyrCDS13731 [Dimorphilus gyrociliatus]
MALNTGFKVNLSATGFSEHRRRTAKSAKSEKQPPERPSAPVELKVTHYNIEISWEDALEKQQSKSQKGDERITVQLQSMDKNGEFQNIYKGYAKCTVVNDLEAWTQYRFRVRFQNDFGVSDWSPEVCISTKKEPLTGDNLHRAIALDDFGALERVIESGDVHIDTPDKYGFSPLMQASQKGLRPEILEKLIESGADVNLQNEAGKTSLMLAAFAGKLISVKELKHHGARFDLKDKGGSTALHWAVDGGNVEIIEFMVKQGGDVNWKDDQNNWTPLLRLASVSGKVNVGRKLLELGADLNAKDKDGKTALMIAVINGHNELVELLLDSNCDLTIRNDYGKTALEMAQAMEKRRVLRTIEDFMERKKGENGTN